MFKSGSPKQWFIGKIPVAIGIGIGLAIAVVVGQFISPSTSESQPAGNTSAPEKRSPGKAQSITAAEAKLTPVNRTLEATGTVNAFELIPVLSQASGRKIIQVLVEEGAGVKAGQPLAILDSTVLRAQLTQARASVAQAEARLAELRAGSRTEEVTRGEEAVKEARGDVVQAKEEVLQAEADVKLIQGRVTSNRFLEEEGAIARDRFNEILNQETNIKSRLAQAKARVRNAEARVRNAEASLTELKRGPRPEIITQAEAQLAQARGQVQLIAAQLEDMRVVAPRSGIVAERNARVGDITSSSDRLFTIIENARLELLLKVPETQIGQIKSNQPVRITSDANPDLRLLGRVRTLDPLVDEESRQATVKVDLPRTGGLKPGMFLRGAIVTSAESGVTIPAGAALPQEDGTAVVFVIQSDNTVVSQPVTLGGILPDDRIEILSGLTLGDRVAVKGAPYLKNGDLIEIASESFTTE
ncbi:efflux RND transporter periplasmic adaptor subunit [Spirulina sp. 06S082]|uniref:efflux RND transporter periplasmic adaptor subunit n=1 Tax=Spirulina sp. 06S082 TaxID=3110248 RepID=UPI002B213750|nr:efflux RND transporter periplasmic adaptor subunit [Spirulina sp. 06S082]MEA5470787.1 efflux RND transporter periplasmic adaptor subunit [Spirulina sp. 06S082]